MRIALVGTVEFSRHRGATIGVEYAEAFMLIREVG